MRPRQKIELERSRMREEMKSLTVKEVLSDNERTRLNELQDTYVDSETELRSAIATDSYQEDTSDKAWKEVEHRASALEECWLLKVVNGETIDTGPVGEYRQELGFTDKDIDVNLLVARSVEDRADVATPGPNAKATPSTISPRVFRPTVLSSLGIRSEMVSPAQRNYPVLTTGTTAAMKSADESQESSAGAFSVTELTPKQARGRVTMRSSELAIFPQFEAALRRDLGQQIDDVVSNQLINGDGTGGNIDGLTTDLTERNTPSDTVNYARFITALVSMVDGTYAADTNDLRVILGLATWRLAMTSQKSDESDMYALDWLRQKAKSVHLSSFIPAPITTANDNERNGGRVFATKARGLGGSYGFPMWRNVRIIRDEASDADKGWVHITANLNWNFKITRTHNWVRTILKVQ